MTILFEPFTSTASTGAVIKSVRLMLKRTAAMSKLAGVAVVVTGTAIADVDGMAQAVANWDAIAKRLDGGAKFPLMDVGRESRIDWQAADQQEFLRVVEKFEGEMEALRGYCEHLKALLDEVGDAFRWYWFEVGAFVVVVAAGLLVASAMLAVPALAPNALTLINWLGALVAAIVSKMTIMLFGLLGLLAGTVGPKIFNAQMQMRKVAPDGRATIAFKQATITSTLPPYQQPPAPGQVPSGSFDWLAPKREEPAPYGE